MKYFGSTKLMEWEWYRYKEANYSRYVFKTMSKRLYWFNRYTARKIKFDFGKFNRR